MLISSPSHFPPGILALLLAAGVACGGPAGPTPISLSVSSISPNTGSTRGGTAVTLSGKGFSSDIAVTLGGVAATSISIQGADAITAVTPPATAAGAVDIVVTSGGQRAMLPRGFTFVAPSGANRPPVVTAIRSVGTRANQPAGFADLGETVTLIGTVTDVETPTGALTYEWSGPGTFSGSGAAVSWRVPGDLSPTPSLLTVTLRVTESFTEGGVTHKHTGSGSGVIRVHDSQKEILDMGEDFLTLFSRSEVPTEQVLHNFSRTCDGGAGREAEKRDVDRNRVDLVYTKFSITRLPPVTFNFGGVCVAKVANRADACAQFRVHWEYVYKQSGTPGVTDGIDYVTAVYESNRWYLCHSNFTGIESIPTLGITRQVSW